MKQKKDKQKQTVLFYFKKYWVIGTLYLVSILLRLYHLKQLYFFSFDEEVPAFVGRRLILWHHIPLIGGVTPFGFHLAPYFYWVSTVILWMGRLNPIAWGVAGALFSIITVLGMFLVGNELGGKKLGSIAAFLWTFSFLANTYDRHFWALYWGPMTTLLVIFSLIQLIKGKQNYVFLLAITLAFSLHADLSNYLFLVLIALAWFVYKIPISRKVLLAILIVAVSFAPLIVFDLRHDFANTKPVTGLFQSTNKKISAQSVILDNILVFPKTMSRLVFNFGDDEISKYYSYCQSYVQEKIQSVPWWAAVVASIVLLLFLYQSLKKEGQNYWVLVTGLLLIYFLGLNLYGIVLKGPIFEHYLSGLLPIFLLIIAKVIHSFPPKIALALLVGFVLLNLFRLQTATNGFGLEYKEEAISFTMQQVGDQPFSLDSLSTCWKYQGYRYLFAAFGKEPVKSFVDPNLAYLYETTPVAKKHPATVVSFIGEDFQKETDSFYKTYDLYKKHTIKSAKFGRIEVLILDNRSDWFNKL